MKSYCLKCKKDTENVNPRVSNTRNGKTVLLSKCAKCASKKSRFIKNQDAEMYLKEPGFTYTACGPFIKNKERIQKFKETEDTNYIYKNELDKACFQHDMAHEDFKDLARRTASD